MGTTTFVDMLLFLKKRVKTIIAFILVGAVIGYVLALF